jgi:hypothetical protein
MAADAGRFRVWAQPDDAESAVAPVQRPHQQGLEIGHPEQQQAAGPKRLLRSLVSSRRVQAAPTMLTVAVRMPADSTGALGWRA